MEKEPSDNSELNEIDFHIKPMFVKEKPIEPHHHPLAYTWCLSYFLKPVKFEAADYVHFVQPVACVRSVEQFWKVYLYIKTPDDINLKADLHFFKKGIKPVWEDESNIRGGKFILRLRRGLVARYWELLLLALVGNQFRDGVDICGAVCSVRQNEEILSLWNRTADNVQAIYRMLEDFRGHLNLPPNAIVEYKRHDDSLKDKKSYSNRYDKSPRK